MPAQGSAPPWARVAAQQFKTLRARAIDMNAAGAYHSKVSRVQAARAWGVPWQLSRDLTAS